MEPWIYQSADQTEEEIARWINMSYEFSYISYSIIAGGRTIIAIASIYMLVVVVIQRKRYDFVYAATILSFLISGCLGGVVGTIIVINAYKLEEDPVAPVAIYLAIEYAFYTIGHQFFASQYLQTSFSMPVMFSEAKLEHAFHKAMPKGQAGRQSGWQVDEIHKELLVQGDDVNTTSFTGLLTHADEIITKKKARVEEIEYNVHIMNGIYVLCAIGGTCTTLIDRQYFYISTCCLLIFKNIILVFALCRISNFIKTLNNAAPNQKLMIIHYFNVTSYTVIYVLSSYYYVQFVAYEDDYKETNSQDDKLNENKMYVAFTICIGIQGLFQVYNILFLFVLFYKQTAPVRSNNELHDHVLNKKVSSIVFLQNQKLVKEQVIGDLERSDERKSELLRQAQANEYMYEMMKK